MPKPLEPGINEVRGGYGVKVINIGLERMKEFCRVFWRDWWDLFPFFCNLQDIVIVE